MEYNTSCFFKSISTQVAKDSKQFNLKVAKSLLGIFLKENGGWRDKRFFRWDFFWGDGVKRLLLLRDGDMVGWWDGGIQDSLSLGAGSLQITLLETFTIDVRFVHIF